MYREKMQPLSLFPSLRTSPRCRGDEVQNQAALEKMLVCTPSFPSGAGTRIIEAEDLLATMHVDYAAPRRLEMPLLRNELHN